MSQATDLVYFVHSIDDIQYGGWFRLMAPDCVEVLAPGLMTILSLDGRPAQEVSCRVLEEFIRGRLKIGAPVPAVAPATE